MDQYTLYSPKTIFPALISLFLPPNQQKTLLSPNSLHWLDFCIDRIHSETAGYDSIYGTLHVELSKKTLFSDAPLPSLADWVIFASLFGRIKAMTPSIAAKYYRLIRWLNYMQTFVTDNDLKKDNVHSFIPASFDFNSILSILDGISPLSTTATSTLKTKKEKKGIIIKDGIIDSKNGKSPDEMLHPFARVDLCVGKIISVEKHPNADRLYIEQVDLNESVPRTVVSGLVEHVPISELSNRLCVFICNLKPASICKILSSAMLLVAKTDDGTVLEPLIPPAGAKPGDRISLEGVTAQPDTVIKPKETTWEDVRSKLRLIEGQVYYENRPLAVADGPIISKKVKSGIVS